MHIGFSGFFQIGKMVGNMKGIFTLSFLLLALLHICVGDIYLHWPPGSNNRLNGDEENVENNKRLFDSENNNKAGYNVGDSRSEHVDTKDDNIPETDQRPLEFYMSGFHAKARSEVQIMWTNQHGTGPKTDDRVESQVILQYMCQPYPSGKVNDITTDFELHTIRNGEKHKGQHPAQHRDTDSEKEKKAALEYGLHEPIGYYDAYTRRDRNKRLFTADQLQDPNNKKNTAKYTRQNAGGTRYGLEVPEERDYYPYWGPTPWNDIAIMVSDKETEKIMNDYVKDHDKHSKKELCIITSNKKCPNLSASNKCVGSSITEASCKKEGGSWEIVRTQYKETSSGPLSSENAKTYSHSKPYQPHEITQGTEGSNKHLVKVDTPDVIYAPSTVVNHNGMSTDGKFSSYTWRIPYFPSGKWQRCVLRIRYNITTSDVPRDYDVDDNDKVKNNPTIKAVDGKTDLKLALNTAQLPRTFQDRTHVFYLKPRPTGFGNRKVIYIGGMGKRGNIVQTYPAMEYRFYPDRIEVTTDDILCFAWSGSNNNPQGNDGQGEARTDRTNVCWVKEGCSSLKPAACSSLPLEVVDHVDEFDAEKLNIHLNKGCYTGDNDKKNTELNEAPASCNPPCFRIKKTGKYCYMSTRNNNFSNRRHIGQIIVK